MLAGQRVDIELVENGLAQLLLRDSKIRQNEDDDDEGDSEESAQDFCKARNFDWFSIQIAHFISKGMFLLHYRDVACLSFLPACSEYVGIEW